MKTIVRKGLAVLALLGLFYGLAFCVGLMYGLSVGTALINAVWSVLGIGGLIAAALAFVFIIVWALDILTEK